VYAWPDAEVAVMGADSAVRVLHRKQLAAAGPDECAPLIARLVEEHKRTAGGLDRGVELGVVDAVIDPADTREWLISAFAAAPAVGGTGRGRHGNIPL
jgi:acetyl-CoA/propionyl-CoA carboxylase carboxyl transferase subunit